VIVGARRVRVEGAALSSELKCSRSTRRDSKGRERRAGCRRRPAYHVVLAVKDEAEDGLAAGRRSEILDGCARRDPRGAGNPAHQLLEEFIMSTVTVPSIDAQVGPFRLIPLAQLALSPLNVRQTDVEQGIDELAALIQAQGVLQNLTVYEDPETSRRRRDAYCVIAGGRRWRALQLLVKQQHITPAYEVPCRVTSYDRAVEISLAENCGREAMHPADQFEAFRKLIDAGQSIEHVAARFGVTPLIVQRRLKLANVSPDFIALYRARDITLEHLMAFAVTDDHERQRQVWKGLKPYERHPSTLRRVLTENEVSLRAPIARFVGLKAYEKAGGQVRRDLFSEEDEAFLLDPALLEKLANEKLTQHAAKLKRDGAAWVDIAARLDYSERAAYTRVATVLREPTEAEQRQLAELEARKSELAQQTEVAQDDEARLDALDDELQEIDAALETLHEARSIPCPEQQRLAGAVVSIGRNGKVHVERDLLKPEDAKRFKRPRQNEEDAKAAVAPGEHSAALMRRLTAHRTLALQATLMRRSDVAVAALTHRLVLRTFFLVGGYDSAVRVDPERVELQQHAADLGGCKAHAAIEAQREQLRSELPQESEALLDWLLAQPQATVLRLLAFCVAVTVDGVKSHERANASDALAQAADLDMREWWTPTAENYFGSIPKARILEVVAEAVAPDAAASLTQLRKAALAKAAEERLVGSRWLPTVFRSVTP
jgi:ParB family transcriptional regulator, chromosome partitioning protein